MNAMPELLRVALRLAATGVPVLPLRAGKLPFGNCPACARSACGDRPNMKVPGTDLGLSRSDQLKILGNGVVIHQAALAYSALLTVPAPEAADPNPSQLALDIA